MTFGEILNFHIVRGTRPGGVVKRWDNQLVARKLGKHSKTIEHWRHDRNAPPKDTFPALLAALFGDEPSKDTAEYAAWRLRFTDAFERRAQEKSERAQARRNATSERAGSSDLEHAVIVPDTRDEPLGWPLPVRVPTHFTGRDTKVMEIRQALQAGEFGIVAVRGMRGAGKTTLAAAYGDSFRRHYGIVLWVTAENETSLHSDFGKAAMRLGWPGSNGNRSDTLAIIEKLSRRPEKVLLIFDDARGPKEIEPYLPHSGSIHVVITSTSHTWRKIATQIEVNVWDTDTGADYLLNRTGQMDSRADAKSLSQKLGGLPLAHEQAAAYCERLSVSFSDYEKLFDAAPLIYLDDARHAPEEYKNGMTVAKTFSLAIAQANYLHPAASLAYC